MIKLRGHHLVCLHYFDGEGYSQKFIDKLKDVLSQAEKGEDVLVIGEVDDVCAVCHHVENNFCAEDDDGRITNLDKQALEYIGAKIGDTLDWLDLATKVKQAPQSFFLEYCGDCQWQRVCKTLIS